MKRFAPLILLAVGIALFLLAFLFYQKSERIKSETDVLRAITTQAADIVEDASLYEPEPEPEPDYDANDLDQTPPDVTPFLPSTVCYTMWGNQLRLYCGGGDNAALELVDGGDDQAETMRVLRLCLNDLVQQMDTYETDLRPMDSDVEQTEVNRQTLACDLTERYGDSPVFNDGSLYYMVKEHMESGNISRLSNQ